MNHNTFNVIVRISIGLILISSSILKLYPIEPFEYGLVEKGIVNWQLSQFVSRLIIGTELLLGSLLVTGFWKKNVLKAAFLLLSTFTVYLFFLYITKGNSAVECGCMGEYLPMTPLQSVFKNLVLLGAVAFLYYKDQKTGKAKYFIVPALLMSTSLILPFILNPMDLDSGMQKHIAEVNNPFRSDLLTDTNNNGLPVDFQDGDHIVAFLSPACMHCEHVAYKISIFQKDFKMPPVHFVFIGNEKHVDNFFQKTNSRFPYLMADPKSFFQLNGPSLPSVQYIRNGEVIEKWDKRTLSAHGVQKIMKTNF